ncbi:hypothetical protein JNW90_08965 [Micromonospora sp. STR1s_5]|nr:hypothetical protein [Micromonospora sp. STR1s_5]
MRSPCKPPTTTHTFILGVLTTITAPLVTIRVLHSMAAITITNPALNAATSIATVLLMSATFGLGWRRSILGARAERADFIQRISQLEKRVEDAENAAWWGTAVPEDDVERTVELGPTVVAFRHRESRQRGAS